MSANVDLARSIYAADRSEWWPDFALAIAKSCSAPTRARSVTGRLLCGEHDYERTDLVTLARASNALSLRSSALRKATRLLRRRNEPHTRSVASCAGAAT
jgi:hypothetical protein